MTKRTGILAAQTALALLILFLLFIAPIAAAAPLPAQEEGQKGSAQAGSTGAQTQEGEAEKEVTTYTLPPEQYQKAVEYARARNRLYFISVAWGVVVVLLILFLGIAAKFRDWAETAASNGFLQAAIFVPLLILTMDLLKLPASLYGHWLSDHYGLSKQSWGAWAWVWTKGEFVGLVIAVPLIALLYAVIRKFPRRWWVAFWLVSLPINVIGVLLWPLLVEPLFSKVTPLGETQPALVEELSAVVERAGLEIPPERMFVMDASTRTRAVNAYVTGFGPSKRVVVWDTMIEKMTTEQTVIVFGHEAGHYVLNHIFKGMGVAAVVTLVFLFLGYRGIGWLLSRWGERWSIRGVGDWASFPALLLVLALLSFLSSPLLNALSRYREHEADIYALEVTRGIVPHAGRVAAGAFQVMGEINLADPEPGEFIKLWRYSHPPLKERIEFALEYDPWSKGEEPRFVK